MLTGKSVFFGSRLFGGVHGCILVSHRLSFQVSLTPLALGLERMGTIIDFETGHHPLIISCIRVVGRSFEPIVTERVHYRNSQCHRADIHSVTPPTLGPAEDAVKVPGE